MSPPGTKCSTRARDDYDASIAIASGVLEYFSQIASHVANKGVQFVQTIQRDRRDTVSLGDLNVRNMVTSVCF